MDAEQAEIEKARSEIMESDLAMAELFARRMAAVKRVAAWKRERGIPILDAAQEARVLERSAGWYEDPETLSYYLAFVRDTMAVSKQYQARLMEGLRAAYCGVEGAFAHIAARRIFPHGTPRPYGSFEDAYDAVVRGECDCAVLPVENSYAGEVGPVHDLMFRGDLYVNGLYELRVTQNLLGTPDARTEDVKTVLSHPQALSQCRGFLLRHGLDAQEAGNTAVAARTVAETGDKTLAAIASAETAKLYGLRVLERDISESRSNTTRFAVFSRTENHPAPGQDTAFLLLFTVRHAAGALAKAVNVIGDHGFNMRTLRSRPMKTLAWKYYFYVEAEGDVSSREGRRMLSDLAEHCSTLKVAGRYVPTEEILEEDP